MNVCTMSTSGSIPTSRKLCLLFLLAVISWVLFPKVRLRSPPLKIRKRTINPTRHPRSNHAAAIVYRALAPIRPVFMEKILAYAQELDQRELPYDLIVLVDETNSEGTEERLMEYYKAHESTNATFPIVFPVTETTLFEEYPELRRYAFGTDNQNNESGHCCGLAVMWQMFVPMFTMALHYLKGYDYAWTLEGDIGTVGQYDRSLVDIVHSIDALLPRDPPVDLVASYTYANHIPRNNFMRARHTRSFHQIVDQMYDLDLDKPPPPHWTTNSAGHPPRWSCVTDAVQRHSSVFSEYLYHHISQNTYAFGECFVQPMAWNGNFTMRELSQVPLNDVNGFEKLTGSKSTMEEAREKWKQLNNENVTLVFHENLPSKEPKE